jgi:hypothetical protein
MATPITSARLTTGLVSQEQHTHPLTNGTQYLRSQARTSLSEMALEELKREITGLVTSNRTTQYDPNRTYAIERPAWQAFLLTVQLHHPSVAAELEPAHKIGLLTNPAIYMSFEAIDTLNYFIEQWYGMEVEVITTQVSPEPLNVNGYPESVAYLQPYRPVTGLKVIVTHTYQWAVDQYSQRVMREREEWGRMGGVDTLKKAWKLYVQEKVPAPLTKKRSKRYKNWLHFFAGA